MQKGYNNRFYLLDLLRGLAAIGVVLFHWNNFAAADNPSQSLFVQQCPLPTALFMFYWKGYYAVDLFFCLSGFIFYCMYSKGIATRVISALQFAWLRFSRLYPLHFISLLLVVISQSAFFYEKGHYFVTAQNNDLKHFFLNLFFVSSWGFESGPSFNSPAWSISVEVFLYAVFFISSRLLPIRLVVLMPISLVGLFIIRGIYGPLGHGIGSFFLGGSVFLVYQKLIFYRHADLLAKWLLYVMAAAWELVFITSLPGIDLSSYFDKQYRPVIQYWVTMYPIVVLFPLTVLSVAMFETHKTNIGKRLTILGDISYSVYLLHFPLQILFYGVVTHFAPDKSVIYSSWFMGVFFAMLLPLSLISHRCFELPTQNQLRRIFNS